MDGCNGDMNAYRDSHVPALLIPQAPVENRGIGGVKLGSKLLQCVHSLIMNPKLPTAPKVAQLLGTSVAPQRFTLEQVKEHSDSVSCWIVLHDKVYDVTELLSTHPGGCEIILENAGSDATVPFESKGHSSDANSMLQQYCIGHLVEADKRTKKRQIP